VWAKDPFISMIGEVIYFVGLIGAVGLFVFGLLRNRKAINILDTAGLYLPLAHLSAGAYWLLLGQGQGRHTSINLYGLYLRFHNPTLLYGVIADVCLFVFLKHLQAVTYSSKGMRACFGGVVFASYLMLHGSMRIVLSVFEKKDPVYLYLTPTQITLAVYILFSMSIFTVLFFKFPTFKAGTPWFDAAQDPVDDLKRLLFPAGLTAFYLTTTFLIFYLTIILKVWKWPIQPVASLADAYGRVLYYMPVLAIAASALAWMKKNNEPLLPWFKRGRLSGVFVIGLLVSIYYSFELLVLKGHMLRGVLFWPPVIVLSVMNAFCEEIMYRLVLYRAVIRAGYSQWVALIAQSVVYSLIHFMVVGAVLGLFSLVYGFVLGMIVQRSKSVSQAVFCHFIIDIGCIGMPLLRL
jgi:membrane protease YdiL (CAAX protease family)